MIVTALSALAAAGVAAWNQHKNNEATKEQQRLNKHEQSVNVQDKIRSEYRNSLDSPTAKGQIENIRRNATDANMSRDNANVAGNLTHQNTLASKNATNTTVANATNNIVASQERAQAIKDEQFMNRDKALNAVDQAYKGQEARSRDALTSNLIGAIGDVASTYNSNIPTKAEKEALKSERNIESAMTPLTTSQVDKAIGNKVSGMSKQPSLNLADLNEDSGIMSVVGNARNRAEDYAIANMNHNSLSDELADIDTSTGVAKPTNNGSFNWFTNAFKNGEMDKSDYSSYIKKRRGLLYGNNNINRVNN